MEYKKIGDLTNVITGGTPPTAKVINQLLQKWNYMYHVTIEKVK